MERRSLLGGLALATVAPVGALARPAMPAVLEVLTTHLANADRFEHRPKVGQRLVLRRDPSRAFDPAAVAVETEEGQRVGYLPPAQAGVLSRLMDHGASASAQLSDTGKLQVFLHLA